MNRFHEMRVFQRVLFKRYNCLGLQDWFVDSGTIAGGSVSQASEGRHYYRSISLYKEGFDALLQRKVEDITNKFESIHPDLLSYLTELRQRPSSFKYHGDEIINSGELLYHWRYSVTNVFLKIS